MARVLGNRYRRCIMDGASPVAISSALLQSVLVQWSGFEQSGTLNQHTHMASPNCKRPTGSWLILWSKGRIWGLLLSKTAGVWWTICSFTRFPSRWHNKVIGNCLVPLCVCVCVCVWPVKSYIMGTKCPDKDDNIQNPWWGHFLVSMRKTAS